MKRVSQAIELTTLQLSQIMTKDQENTHRDMRDEKALIHHLKEGGYFVPPVIKQQSDGWYRIIAGFRTVAAANFLKWKALPVYLINSSIAVSNSRLLILSGSRLSSDELTTSYPQKQYSAKEIENG